MMPERLIVHCLTPSVGGGGAERHLVRVLNHLPKDRYDITLFAARPGGSYEYLIEPHIRYISLGSSSRASSTGSMFRSVLPLRRRLFEERPDILLTQMLHGGMVALAASAGMGASAPKIVLGIQNPPLREGGKVARSARMLGITKALYSHVDCLVALSRGVAEEIKQVAPRIGSRVEVIHNACIDRTLFYEKEQQPSVPVRRAGTQKLVVSCGRLVPQKNYPVLLRAVAVLRKSVDARVLILGSGPLKDDLERLCLELGIADYVDFLGFQANPFPIMAAADLFVLSSDFEGFGNVIAEAMACGLSVVATDCPYGPREILGQGGGILVARGDYRGLADAMRRVLLDENERRRLCAEATECAKAFTAEKIAAQFDRLLQAVVKKPIAVKGTA